MHKIVKLLNSSNEWRITVRMNKWIDNSIGPEKKCKENISNLQ